MPEKEKETENGQISRRQFIKNAGIVVGGTAVGSSILLSACNGGETITKTVTKTTTVGGQTVTKYVCPYDNQEFDTLAALKAHLESTHGEVGAGAVEGLVTLNVNGEDVTVAVEPEWSLAFVLREKLGLIGTKVGCDRGECGTCTIHMDGQTVYACMVLACEAEGHAITTIEGLADGATLHPVQQLFMDRASYQCGYCTPGNIMTTVALLAKNPSPTRDQVREALSGNMCFCIDYTRTIDTILEGGS